MGRVQGPQDLGWGLGRPYSPGAPSCPSSMDWGLCLPTSGKPGLQGADRFSLLPGNCKSCWLLLGAGWGGQRREDRLSSMGRSWWGKRQVLELVCSLCGDRLCVPIYSGLWIRGVNKAVPECPCPWVGIRRLHRVCCMLWQCLPELWLQEARSLEGTIGGLTNQWLLNKGALQIEIHRHSKESNQPEDWELKQDVCWGGKGESVLQWGLCMAKRWWWPAPLPALWTFLVFGLESPQLSH